MRTRLLASDPNDPDVGRALFEILLTTHAAPLWRAAGARLMLLSPHEALYDAAHAALEHGAPAWRLQPLAGDPEVAWRLLLELQDMVEPRNRVAGIRGLAPRVDDPEIRAAIVACIADENSHVCSTAIEVLRPVATEPAVRDALLALYRGERSFKGRVDRALRRALRAAAGDPEVQRALIDGLRGERAWIAAEALAGAPGSEALADLLLPVLAATEHLFTIAEAFKPVAHLGRVTAAVLPRLADPTSTEYQPAMRIVGRGTTTAARDAVFAGLTHPTNWQRWTALQQLGWRLADPAARAAALGCLRDEDDSVRMIALQILTTLDHDPEVRAAARVMLADPSDAVAIAAVGLLARSEADPAAWAVLAPHVTGSRSSVHTRQWQHIYPCAQIGVLVRLPEVRDAVAAMLTAWRSEPRVQAARALRGATPCPSIAALLTTCIAGDDPDIAGAAYECLTAWVQ